jgi:delta8-fatty-acid desaturase
MEYDSAAKFLVKFQKYMYYPILVFGRFNLYRLSWAYLLSGKAPRKGPASWHRYLELLGQFFFWSWYGYGIIYKSIPSNWGRFTFFMVSHMTVAPLHVQITLSHFAMSTADLGPQECFAQKMLRTTMDVVSAILRFYLYVGPMSSFPARSKCDPKTTTDLPTNASYLANRTVPNG